tara:strand:- start:473 stop:865 length:393 start_codon:yes stop_codon:yes gene_type:complete
MTYDFATELFSDLHKDAFGYRPQSDHPFYSSSDDDKQYCWDYTVKQLEIRELEEKEAEAEAVKQFKLDMFSINLMDTNEQALARMVDVDTLEHDQDIEHWVWSFGILFTPFGKEIVETLKNMKLTVDIPV